MGVDVASLAYSVTIAAGGLLGYVRAGSIPSLMAGLAFGSLMGYGTYQTSVNPQNVNLSLVTSSVLAGVMGYRFYNSGKFMPAGLVFGLSLLMIARFGYRVASRS
ncbi:transmembrane protein 14C-like [Crassostrea virginica]|uniref:Transmembrane protein 14C-like n=1 Tax=Crassostrea virginica TaxID=6565 RepID=A0A8B8CSK1_CRAVI|nr:transmembrane protein 14C-like [Crassostrea virginica]